jgi:anti-anti-sigma factor
MAETVDLGPLKMAVGDDTAVVWLADPQAIVLEISEQYEDELQRALKQVLDSGRAVVLDLEDLPALSSRQLGLMLTLQKVVTPRQGKLPVWNVSPGVRRVLKMTRTGHFFALPEG